jgi:hypothetical protein
VHQDDGEVGEAEGCPASRERARYREGDDEERGHTAEESEAAREPIGATELVSQA